MSGYTARKISNLRPDSVILAGCPNEKTAYSVALNWGVYPVFIPELDKTEEVIMACKEKAIEFMELEKGEAIIITGGFPSRKKQHTNLLRVEVVD